MFSLSLLLFFFNDTATTEIYTLSLHDALPISGDVEKLTPKGMALGIDSGEVFNRVCSELTFELATGDCLLLYTRSEEHTSELQSHSDLVCRLLLEKKKLTRSPFHSFSILQLLP